MKITYRAVTGEIDVSVKEFVDLFLHALTIKGKLGDDLPEGWEASFKVGEAEDVEENWVCLCEDDVINIKFVEKSEGSEVIKV